MEISILQNKTKEEDAQALLNVGVHVASGALCGYIFQTVTPMAGGIFAVSAALSGIVIAAALDNLFGDGSSAERTVKFILRFLGRITAGICFAGVFGYSVSFWAGIKLSILMVPSSLIAIVGLECLKKIADTDVKKKTPPPTKHEDPILDWAMSMSQAFEDSQRAESSATSSKQPGSSNK